MKNLLFLAFILFTSLSVYSCNKKEIHPTQNSEKKEYSGEELFRGIFFGEGEVIEKISFVCAWALV